MNQCLLSTLSAWLKVMSSWQPCSDLRYCLQLLNWAVYFFFLLCCVASMLLANHSPAPKHKLFFLNSSEIQWQLSTLILFVVHFSHNCLHKSLKKIPLLSQKPLFVSEQWQWVILHFVLCEYVNTSSEAILIELKTGLPTVGNIQTFIKLHTHFSWSICQLLQKVG